MGLLKPSHLQLSFQRLRDATKTIANAANDSYCWLKNGGYMVCDGKWFETISERLVENKTDNKYYYNDTGRW
jgi:hypothetical protein